MHKEPRSRPLAKTRSFLDTALKDHERAVKHKVMKYVSEFLTLKCAPDFLAAGLLPKGDAGKELTEIMAMYSAVRRHLVSRLGDESIVLLDVGCGTSPRGAALFALRSKWGTFAIDPRLRMRDVPLDRVSLFKGRIEDLSDELFAEWASILETEDNSLIVCINTHGHASLDYLNRIPGEVWSVSMPCCVPLIAPETFKEIERYRDPAVASPMNEIIIHHRA